MRNLLVLLPLALLLAAALAGAKEAPKKAASTEVHEGLRLILDKPYSPWEFDDEVFDALWETWPEALREKARKATPLERRRMAFRRYGLQERPDRPGVPYQYVVDKGRWVINCLACHTGKVRGELVWGAPNTHIALETLVEEVRETKLRLKKAFTVLDMGSLVVPLGTTNGTTNAISFSVGLMSLRDKDLNVRPRLEIPDYEHHDLEAPPWWYFRKRTRIYIDGLTAKGHRPLLGFMMAPVNSAAKVKSWETDAKKMAAFLETLRPPPYPFAVDRDLAKKGRGLFQRNCAECHGTYGKEPRYPNKTIPIDELGTDPVRLRAVTKRQRTLYSESWLGHHGKKEFVADPGGYVAPPLDGVWASAPYFHNGSVPTLWHVLRPDKRPVIWRRSEDGYSEARVGLQFEELDEVPRKFEDRNERRRIFDTRKKGKSAEGHRFFDDLSEDELRALLEYLKTL